MTLTIDLPPAAGAKLAAEAIRAGVTTDQYARQLLLEKTSAPTEAVAVPDETIERFVLSSEAWDEFNRLLDAPVREIPKLRELLAFKPVWEQ
ncbi:MAG: DUF1778 domain-containing protein [Capsulimonadaceae bacterium]